MFTEDIIHGGKERKEKGEKKKTKVNYQKQARMLGKNFIRGPRVKLSNGMLFFFFWLFRAAHMAYGIPRLRVESGL